MLLLSPPNYRREDHLESRFAWTYTPRTEEQLNTLARDVVQNRVFLSSMIRRAQDISMVFMVLALADRRTLRHLEWVGARLFYEYFAKAGSRSMNGYPCFFSFHYLDLADAERLFAKIKRLQEAMKAALGE